MIVSVSHMIVYIGINKCFWYLPVISYCSICYFKFSYYGAIEFKLNLLQGCTSLAFRIFPLLSYNLANVSQLS